MVCPGAGDWRNIPVREAAGGKPGVGFTSHPDCSRVKFATRVLFVTVYPYDMFPYVWVFDIIILACKGSRPQKTPEFVRGFATDDGRTHTWVNDPPFTFENMNLFSVYE
jgi:hypothetical protein